MNRNRWGAAALALCSLTFDNALAWVNTPCYYYDWEFVTELELSTGYRQDNLHWSIADPTGSPNILSELQWKNIQIWEAKAQGRVLFLDTLYVRGSADYGRIFHGSNQDSDYAGDDKTLEFSRSRADSNKGEVFDFSGGVGLQITLCLCNAPLRLVPLIGYSYSEQHFRDSHGELLINSAFSPLGDELPLGDLGPFPGLHSNYRAKWRGAWIGVDAFWPLYCDVDLFATFEYHRVKYHGTAHWNLRTDFVRDFQQKAKNGYGYYGSAGFKYKLCCDSYVGLTGSYTWMNSKHGTDTTYFALGPETTRFNGATWHSWSILADVGIDF